MQRKPKYALLCGVPLALPFLMAGYGAFVMERESALRDAVRLGDAPAVRGVERSEDYVWHSGQFQRAARELIASGRCTETDFEIEGGFVRVDGEAVKYKIACPSSGSEPTVVQLIGSVRYRLDG